MSSSFYNHANLSDSQLRRSSRLLPKPQETNSENVPLINTPLINAQLVIHQTTAELASFDFDSDESAKTGAGNNNKKSSLSSNSSSSTTSPITTNHNSTLQNHYNGNNAFHSNEEYADDFPEDMHNHSVGSQVIDSNNNLIDMDLENPPQNLESFNALLGNENSYNNNSNLIPGNNGNNESSNSRASSIINFTKNINRTVSNKFLTLTNSGTNNVNTSFDDDYYNSYSSDNCLQNNVNTSFSLQDYTISTTTSLLAFFSLKSISSFSNDCLNLLPSVFLGLLLNVLDALSYGMIIFPINQPVFSDLGPSGLSMFYVSSIVSQLTFSLGGSSFRAAIGSEMIEVTPFFHAMADSIMVAIGESNPANKESIAATTIVCYVCSTFFTGAAFFILGKFKLGRLVGFFPRHILLGCIGGVGYFLLVTGMEVSSRMSWSFAYNWETLSFLFADNMNFIKWFSAISIAAILIIIQSFSKRLASFSLLLPTYFMFVFALIHFIIWANPHWDLDLARKNGFIFDVASPSNSSAVANESWYHFYSLFKFKYVRWDLILKQIPSMLALTFFGILHVPINVPALAMSLNRDDIDLDQELIGHGYSNFLSAMAGSIQNYLVYSNSLLFYRSGVSESALAGILLAFFTAIVMFIGPVLIKFIPVCVVGSLIFLLGYELMKEGMYDSYSKLSNFDYCTIIVIIITMGLVDFVYGVLLGILIAFVSFIVENANQNPIKNIFTGEVARSTVQRNSLTNKFLKNIGYQTLIFKLQGNIFFGSIGKIEKEIKRYYSEETKNGNHSFRYLVLDFGSVLSVDYTAAEGFQNIKNFTDKSNAYLILSSINNDSIYDSLLNVGVLPSGTIAVSSASSELSTSSFDNRNVGQANSNSESTQLFHDLNSALEWCENEYLIMLYQLKHLSKIQKLSNLNYNNSNLDYGSIANDNSANFKKSLNNSSQQSQSGKFESSGPQPISALWAGDKNIAKRQSDDFKFNLTESYLNPMSFVINSGNSIAAQNTNAAIINGGLQAISHRNSISNASPRKRTIMDAASRSLRDDGGSFHATDPVISSHQQDENPVKSSNISKLSAIGSLDFKRSSANTASTLHSDSKTIALSSGRSASNSAVTNGINNNGNAPTSGKSNNNPIGSNGITTEEHEVIQLIVKTFYGISKQPESFWKPLVPFLHRVELQKDQLYTPSSNNSSTQFLTTPVTSPVITNHKTRGKEHGLFFIVESGLLQLSYDYHNQCKISETLVPKTGYASLGVHKGPIGGHRKKLDIVALRPTKILKLNTVHFKKATQNDLKLKEIANELLIIEANLLSERFDRITNYILISN